MRWRVRLQVQYRRRMDLALAVVALAVISCGLAAGFFWSPRGAVASPTELEQPRPLQYYLTKDTYPGDQALAACALGFHMASLWEILDTSNLRYNARLGHTRRDSGYGPPTMSGWIRTGYSSGSTGSPGTSNCHAWTSGSGSDVGSYVFLPASWEAGIEDVHGWAVATAVCSLEIRVWCVGDESVVYLPLLMRNYTG